MKQGAVITFGSSFGFSLSLCRHPLSLLWFFSPLSRAVSPSLVLFLLSFFLTQMLRVCVMCGCFKIKCGCIRYIYVYPKQWACVCVYKICVCMCYYIYIMYNI